MHNICSCGNEKFWWIKKRIKCSECLTEYRIIDEEFIMTVSGIGKKRVYTCSEWNSSMKKIRSKKNKEYNI